MRALVNAVDEETVEKVAFGAMPCLPACSVSILHAQTAKMIIPHTRMVPLDNLHCDNCQSKLPAYS